MSIGFSNHKKAGGVTYYSSSRWETALYGGYYNLIFDHPDVSLNNKVDLDVKKQMGLSSWTAEKLMKIYLLRAKELGLSKHLSNNSKKTKITKWWQEKEVLKVEPSAIRDVLNSIISETPEYSNLFDHYRELIESCEITLPMDPPPSSGGSGKKGKGKKKDKEESKSESGASSSAKEDKQKQEKDEENQGGKGKEKSDESPEDEGEDDCDEHGYERTEDPLTYKEGLEKEWKIRKELADYLGEIKKREIYSSFLNGNLLQETKWEHPRDLEQCRFSEDERFYASQLVKTLDINFDPTSDRINSLRTGKLDPRKVAEVIPGNLNVYYTTEENQSTKPFTVVMLQDESGSMSEYDKIHHSKRLLKTLYLAFSEILPQEKIFVYGHSGHGNPRIFVYQDKYNLKFQERIDHMKSRDYNYDGPAIEAIYTKVRAITDDNIIFITLSDGAPCGRGYAGNDAKTSMRKVLEKCRRDGFVTIGLGIKHFNDDGLYNYSSVIHRLDSSMIKQVSHVVNKVVKTEFQ